MLYEREMRLHLLLGANHLTDNLWIRGETNGPG